MDESKRDNLVATIKLAQEIMVNYGILKGLPASDEIRIKLIAEIVSYQKKIKEINFEE